MPDIEFENEELNQLYTLSISVDHEIITPDGYRGMLSKVRQAETVQGMIDRNGNIAERTGTAFIAPDLADEPVDITVLTGTDIDIALDVTALPAPRYRWKRSADGVNGWQWVGNAITGTLSFPNAQPSIGGYYKCEIANIAGDLETSIFRISVVNAIITVQPVGKVLVEGAGTSLTFDAEADTELTFKWQKSANGTTGWTDIAGANTKTLTLTDVDDSDAGYYRGVAIDALGRTTPTNAVQLNMATEIGTLLNRTAFANTTDFTMVNFGSVPTASANKIVITEGASDYTKYMKLTGFETDDENIGIEVQFKLSGAQSSSSYGISVGKKSFAGWFYPSKFSTLSVESGNVHAKLMGDVNGLGTDEIEAYSGNLNYSSGDVLSIAYLQRANETVTRYKNVTKNIVFEETYTTPYVSTVDYPAVNSADLVIFALQSGIDILSVNVTSESYLNPKFFLVGDSKMTGLSAVLKSQRFATIVGTNYAVQYGVFGTNGGRTVEVVKTIDNTLNTQYPTGVPAGIPCYMLICLGRNDLASDVLTATWQANYRTIVNKAIAKGLTVIHILPIPENQEGQTELYDWLLEEYEGGLFIHSETGWSNSTMLAADNIHPSPGGHAHMADLIIDSGFIEV